MNQKIESAKLKSEPKKNILSNALKAFLVGGIICIIAQSFIVFFERVGNFSKEDASSIAVAIMIFISCILTALGIYDRIGQFAGAGTLIPITGFANSMASSALESKSEGVITGIFMNIFKLAGSVIVVGVISAYVLGLIRFLLGW